MDCRYCSSLASALRVAHRIGADWWQHYEEQRVARIRAAGRTTVEEF